MEPGLSHGKAINTLNSVELTYKNHVYRLEVVYMDNHLLILNKAAGQLIQEDKTGDIDLLTLGKHYLKKRFNKPGNVYLGLVHRLDRPVSGLVCFARTSKAAARLARQFRQNRVKKQYLALVEGKCVSSARLEHYLVKKSSGVIVVPPHHARAKKARLHYTSLRNNKTSLLHIDLLTGRPHQIRVQLSEIGYPILGDLRYGANQTFDGKNLALHCYCLGIQHPVKKEWLQKVTHPPHSWNGYYEHEINQCINRGGKIESDCNRHGNQLCQKNRG